MSLVTLVFIAFVIVFSQFNIKPWKNAEKENSLIDWDVTSYYAYLPAYFVHDDITLSFTDNDSIDYAQKHQFWPETATNGGKVIKTTMGMSLLYSPFFLIAHSYAILSAEYLPNGFSKPYELLLALSSIFYLMIGLYYLRKLLVKLYDERVTSITLIAVVFGTNLYYYLTTEPCMSHSYTFSLLSIFVYFVIKWFDRQKLKYAIILGVTGGLITLIRPVNLIIFLFPLLYQIHQQKVVKNLFIQYWKHLLLIAFLVFVFVFPQLLYWKYITDHWFFNSYVGEQFHFDKPNLLEILFSYRSGWLLYSPMMILSLVGFYFLRKDKSDLFRSLLVPVLLNIYVLSCWWCWWFGGSYGLRAFIDFYPFLSIPFAAFVFWVLKQRGILKNLLVCLMLCFICLNLYQTHQKRRNIIHWDSMTKESYWMSFGKHSMEKEDWKIFNDLIQAPDYEKAKKGEDEYQFNPF